MKLRALINLLRRTERALGKDKAADVHVGAPGACGSVSGIDLRNTDGTAPDVYIRACSYDPSKRIKS